MVSLALAQEGDVGEERDKVSAAWVSPGLQCWCLDSP